MDDGDEDADGDADAAMGSSDPNNPILKNSLTTSGPPPDLSKVVLDADF